MSDDGPAEAVLTEHACVAGSPRSLGAWGAGPGPPFIPWWASGAHPAGGRPLAGSARPPQLLPGPLPLSLLLHSAERGPGFWGSHPPLPGQVASQESCSCLHPHRHRRPPNPCRSEGVDRAVPQQFRGPSPHLSVTWLSLSAAGRHQLYPAVLLHSSRSVTSSECAGPRCSPDPFPRMSAPCDRHPDPEHPHEVPGAPSRPHLQLEG